MNNSYNTVDYNLIGLPWKEVYGNQFCFMDLYEFIGKNQFMTTFTLKQDSESCNKYGVNVLGVMHITHEVLKKIINNDELDLKRIQIEASNMDTKLSQIAVSDLKYEGIKISDIEYISFLTYVREAEVHDTGEKKIPIIEIPLDCVKIDVNKMNLWYLTSKHNNGYELIEFEKEQLIGLELARNDGHIDACIANYFGFNEESINANLNVKFQYYKAKENRESLSAAENEDYLKIKNSITLNKIIAVLQEIKRSNVNTSSLPENEILKIIFNSAIDFRPSILQHSKKQIYWDLESYLHIAMRHLKDYQIGDFKKKTPFSYKPEELKRLIEKVIGCIKNEYQEERLNDPDKEFRRQGRMAIRFNDDYYAIRIAADGRVIQFHALKSVNTE